MRYWVRFNKQTLGPYAPEDIRRQAAFTGDTLVCPEGSRDPGDWRRLRDVPELAGTGPSEAAPAQPPAAARDPKELAKLIIKALGKRRG